MASTDRERLRLMLQERSFISGTFKLSSGQTSSYFFDGKQVVLDPVGAHLAGNAVLELIRERAPDANAVAGPTVGADPIVTAAMLLSAGTNQPLTGLFVRSERKDHGTERIIEGPLQRGMRVALTREEERLGTHLTFLATVGSTSPYVGLFGTVWGIMNSFRSLANMSQATLASVAPGISEALVATAMGLFAAIPAVIAYNRFSARVEVSMKRIESFSDEVTSILQRAAQATVAKRS